MARKNEKLIIVKFEETGAKRTTRRTRQVDAAIKKYSASTKEVAASTEFMRVKTSGLRRQLGAIRNQLLVVAFAFGGLLTAINKSVELYKKQWEAEQQLIAGLRNVAGNTIAYTRALIDNAAALQRQTTFSDENIISGMAMLSTFQLNAAAIKEITPRMLDMAAAAKIAGGSEQELKSIAIALGKGLTGQVGSLSRYGVVIDKMGLATARASGKTAEFTFLLEALDANFRGIAQQLATSTIGQLQQLENQLGDMGEKLGRVVLPIKLAWTKFLVGLGETLSFTALLMKNLAKEGGNINQAFIKTFDMMAKLREFESVDLGGFRLPPDAALELAGLNKQLAYNIELQKSRALIGDGRISQQEQLQILDIQRIHLNDLLNKGLIEQIDYWTQITALNNQQTVILTKLNPAQQMQVNLMRQFGTAMAQAAVHGQKMGQAVVSAIRAIAAQLLAEIAIFTLAKLVGFDIGLLMGSGGSSATRFIGGLFGATNESISAGPVSTPAAAPIAPVQQTVVQVNINNLIGEERWVRENLQPTLERILISE